MNIITDIQRKAEKAGIKIDLVKNVSILVEGETTPTNGYFCSTDRVLAVAIDKPVDDWLPIFIHESCHMDQFLQDEFQWEKWNVGYTMFFDWIEGKKELNKKTLLRAFKDIIDCEKDCEKRTVEKIKKYETGIDVARYTQMANLYLYSYAYIMKVRKWKTGIYKNKELTDLCPKTFQADYTKIHSKLKNKLKDFYSD